MKKEQLTCESTPTICILKTLVELGHAPPENLRKKHGYWIPCGQKHISFSLFAHGKTDGRLGKVEIW